MNKRQKLINKTAQHFWEATQVNSHYIEGRRLFFHNFRFTWGKESDEELRKQNRWVQTQYDKALGNIKCPVCNGNNIFKRKVLIEPNLNYVIGSSNQPMHYKRKQYQCLHCWHEFDI